MDNSDYDTTIIILRNYNLEDKNNVLSNLQHYTKLKSFDCSRCDLVELPEKLPNSLMTLICSNNRLTRLPNLDNLTQLQSLWCNNNILSHLPSLSNLTKLELLNCLSVSSCTYSANLILMCAGRTTKGTSLVWTPHKAGSSGPSKSEVGAALTTSS